MSPLYIPRILNLKEILAKKSCFLLGPRQTGKTRLIEHQLAGYRFYNLLDTEIFLRLSRSPRRLSEECSQKDPIVIIDEIQKLPSLLDEVHLLIEKYGIHFLLTGSSTRKLRRGGVNLLGGRAWTRQLHPFCFAELKDDRMDLGRAINYGLIPSIYLSENPDEDLKSYVGSYLREEIAAEGLTRNIPAFSRFLEVAALCNRQLINYTQIASDAQVARSTVQEYFQILKDTLVGYEVSAWKESKKRKPMSTSKFYLFDMGVTRFLQNRGTIRQGSPEFGDFFESYLFQELKAYTDYKGISDLTYWRSKSGYEVDFIVGDQTAIEVKASSNVGPHDLRGLRALQEENLLKHYLLVSLEDHQRRIGSIQILPWKLFLTYLWEGDYN